jgi:hypothetical protein
MDEAKITAHEIAIATPSVVFTPHEGTVGTEVVVSGSGFGPHTGKVLVGGTSTKILSWRYSSWTVAKPI